MQVQKCNLCGKDIICDEISKLMHVYQVHYKITIDEMLKEAFTLPSPNCPHCNGTGKGMVTITEAKQGISIKCGLCKGTGLKGV